MENLNLTSTILIKFFDLELKKIVAEDLAKFRAKQVEKIEVKKAA
jgi:hypothetical protein